MFLKSRDWSKGPWMWERFGEENGKCEWMDIVEMNAGVETFVLFEKCAVWSAGGWYLPPSAESSSSPSRRVLGGGAASWEVTAAASVARINKKQLLGVSEPFPHILLPPRTRPSVDGLRGGAGRGGWRQTKRANPPAVPRSSRVSPSVGRGGTEVYCHPPSCFMAPPFIR